MHACTIELTFVSAWGQSCIFRPVARGGSVGSDETPSQIKGPLFYAKRSTF